MRRCHSRVKAARAREATCKHTKPRSLLDRRAPNIVAPRHPISAFERVMEPNAVDDATQPCEKRCIPQTKKPVTQGICDVVADHTGFHRSAAAIPPLDSPVAPAQRPHTVHFAGPTFPTLTPAPASPTHEHHQIAEQIATSQKTQYALDSSLSLVCCPVSR